MDDAIEGKSVAEKVDVSSCPLHSAESNAILISPGGSSDLDQCGDDVLDTVDSVVGCVNQNHAELQHQYEETLPEQQLDDASQQVAMICSSEAQSCGAVEPLADMMMLPDVKQPNDVAKSPRSLYQCQECATTKVLRQLQPGVCETIWWPCEKCQKDCRWNPVVRDGTAEQDGCTMQ